jgi:hypothetical protein
VTEQADSSGPLTTHVAVDWSQFTELVPVTANAFSVQLGPPTRDGKVDTVYVAAGLLSLPVFAGAEADVRAQIEAVGTLYVRPIVRLAMSPERFRELLKALTGFVDQLEQAERASRASTDA